MRHSGERILTTHVGSLPRSQTLVDALLRKDRGEADAAFDGVVRGRGVRCGGAAEGSGHRRAQRRRAEQGQLFDL